VGAHLPLQGLEAIGGEPLIVASATPDLRLPSQLQDITAHWLVPNYTAGWLTGAHVC